jgi:hypothetical protein
MIPYLGDFAVGSVVHTTFNSFTSDDPSASVTIASFTSASVKVYKNNSTSSLATAGTSIIKDFAGKTGTNMISINTAAEAFVAGADYSIMISGTTIDEGDVNAFVGHFSIENRSGVTSDQLDDKIADAIEEIAAAVWDKDITDHEAEGTFGRFIQDSAPDLIADAIWNELASEHTEVDTFGLLVSESSPILKFLFATLPGHGLHLFFKDPASFGVALNACNQLLSSLPDEQRLIAQQLLSWFTGKVLG